ncbi:MAG: GAF domain-containing protein [Deltaproteobacteria bacterium]|nr:GAF domain-containing protein [Deltaproteobacteria bacterium]
METLLQTKKALASLYQISRLTMVGAGRDELIQEVLETIINGLQYDRVALYLLREGTSILEGIINVGCQVSIKGLKYDLYQDDCVETRVVKTGEIIHIRDGCDHSFYTPLDRKRNEVLKRTCCVLLPVYIKQGIIGTMLADRSQRQGAITADDIEILEIFCNQIGIVVENKRLQASNRRKIAELTRLQKITRAMSEPRDLESLYRVITREAVQLGKSQGCWLCLADDENRRFPVAVAEGCGLAEIERLADDGQQAEALAKQQAVYRLREAEAAGGERRLGILALPLVSGKKVLGVINFLYRENTSLAGINLDVLDIFAAQAAKAIENLTFYYHLLEERDFRESILRSTPNSIFTVDRELRITSCNHPARRMFSNFGELYRRCIYDIIDSDSFRQAISQVAAGERSMVQLEVGVQRAEEPDKLFFVSITALHHDWSRNQELLILVQDQTEKKKMDREVERMKRLASIGQLAAGIAHEIRNPLTGMNISLDIIKEEMAGSQYAVKLLDGVSSELDRLETIVSSLLEFSRAGILEIGQVEVDELLRQWLETFREQCRRRDIEVSLELPDRLAPVTGDVEKIRQVIINLSLNAMEAIKGRGKIEFAVFPVPESKYAPYPSWSDSLLDGPRYRMIGISIADSGVGMTPEVKEKIFDPFFTTRNQGTGLGLSIAHNIIKDHQGWIEVDSKPGRGSRFTVFLPVAMPETSAQGREDVKSNTYY